MMAEGRNNLEGPKERKLLPPANRAGGPRAGRGTAPSVLQRCAEPLAAAPWTLPSACRDKPGIPAPGRGPRGRDRPLALP